MKPLTVFNIVLLAVSVGMNVTVYVQKQQAINLWAIGILAPFLAYWIWEARKENRHRRDMQNLVNDLAKQIANGTSAKPCETKYKDKP
ncbi:hypothetical protein [Glutamicibacter sp. AOP3-A1-12]|uniref:hypothetical protein n=1 Tax=Glutamicibacter sp. AOP3-A1-12 TaxID=3457701 RepID=UPI0040334CCF